MLSRYQSSGRVGVATVLGVLPISAALLVVGALYQAVVHYIPFIIVALLAAFLFAAAVMLVVKKVQKLCHCRSAPAAAAVGLLSGALCVAATHYYSMSLHLSDLLPLEALPDFLRLRAEVGWSFGKSRSGIPINGWAVWTVWGVEAAMICLGAVLGGVAGANEPYCEKCSAWADKVRAKVRVREPAPEAVQRVGDAATVHELAATERGGPPGSALEYTIRECPSCQEVQTLSVHYEFEKAQGKKTTVEKKALHDQVLLTPADVERLTRLGAANAAPPPAGVPG